MKTGTGAPDALCDRLQGLVLAHDPFSQLVFQFEQPVRFLLLKPRERNARHGGDDFDDSGLIDQEPFLCLRFPPERFFLKQRFLQFFLFVAQFGGAFEFLVLDGLFFFLYDIVDFHFNLPDFGWDFHA